MNTQLTMWYRTLLITIFAFFALATPAQAQTNSAQTTPSAELRQVIRDRIEQTLQEKKQPGAVEFIGTIGTITKINPATFLLVDTVGRERTVEIGPATTLLSGDKAVALADITLNSSAVVMGLPVDDIVIEARRVLISTQAINETREVFLGSIDKLSRTSLTFTTRSTQEIITVPLTRTTVLEDSLGNEITINDLDENQSIIVVTDAGTNNQRTTNRVRLLVPIENQE